MIKSRVRQLENILSATPVPRTALEKVLARVSNKRAELLQIPSVAAWLDAFTAEETAAKLDAIPQALGDLLGEVIAAIGEP